MTAQRQPRIVDEKTTPDLYFQWMALEYKGERFVRRKLCLEEILTLTFNYYDFNTGTIINSRSAQNVLNANDHLIREDGLHRWALQVADTALTTDIDDHDLERHIAEWTLTTIYNKIFHHRIEILIRSKLKVT